MLAITIALSIYSQAQLAENTNEIVTVTYPKVQQAQQIMNHNNKIARSLRNALLIRDDAKAAKELATIMEKRQENDSAMKKLDEMVKSGKGRNYSRQCYTHAIQRLAGRSDAPAPRRRYRRRRQ
jgi:methyl-accepting chemotaxis protein